MMNWLMLVVLISCLHICKGLPRVQEPEICQFTPQCIEESVLLATNEGARVYTPSCIPSGNAYCKSVCGSLEGCCHPYVVKRDVSHDRTSQSCLPTYFGDLELLLKDQVFARSYYTVDMDPPGGCVAEYDGGSGCSSVVAEWGTYYPVSSIFSKFVYINVECAKCHGETNVEYWDGFHTCLENGEIKLYAVDKIRNNTLNNCYTIFFTRSSYVLKAQCFIKLVDSCSPDFKLSADSHLSRSIVESLCTSGLVSPRRHLELDITYVNIFCLICNVDLNWTNMIEEQKECRTLSSEGKVLPSLTSFIDTSEVDDEGRKRRVIDTKLACSVTTPADCRPVYCSTGKLLMDGSCQFVTDAFVNGQYMLDVTLTYRDDSVLFYMSYIEELVTKEQLKSTLKGPWAEKWDIYAMSVKYYMHHIRPTVDKIYITMVYKPFLIVYIQDLVLEVEYILKATWWSYVTLSRQRQFHLNSTHGHDNKLAKKAWTMIKQQSIIMDTLIQEVQTKHIISPRYNISKNATIKLSKLLFCEQIKLYPDEYILLDDFSFVYLKQQGRLLADGEFIVGNSDTSESIQVCLDDAGYDIGMLPSTAEACMYSPHQSRVLTYIIALVVVYVHKHAG